MKNAMIGMIGMMGLVIVAGSLAVGITGCQTKTTTVASTNATTGVVIDTTVTNEVVDPAVIAVSAGILQGATTMGASYIIQKNTNDIVYLQGVRAALTLELTGTNVSPGELTTLLANVKTSNPAVSAYAQTTLESVATQYSAAYGSLVANGIDANSVAGPLLNAVLQGLNAALGTP
jgi:hypothetical protein